MEAGDIPYLLREKLSPPRYSFHGTTSAATGTGAPTCNPLAANEKKKMPRHAKPLGHRRDVARSLEKKEKKKKKKEKCLVTPSHWAIEEMSPLWSLKKSSSREGKSMPKKHGSVTGGEACIWVFLTYIYIYVYT